MEWLSPSLRGREKGALLGSAPGVKANILAHLYKSLELSFAGGDIWAPPVQECRPTSFSVDPVAPVVSVPVLVG